MYRHVLAAIFLALYGVIPNGTEAAEIYPQRPITLINPYAPGGPVDLIGRVLATELAGVLGQPVIVQNKGGGGTSIGTSFAAKAEPDGYTLLLGTAAAHIVTPLAIEVDYDGVKDFSFVGIVATVPNVLTVHPSVPATNLEEFLDLMRSAPGRYNYVSAGLGSSPHIGMERLKHAAKIDLQHVSYRGAGPAAQDHIAGFVKVGFLNISVVGQHIKSGRLRALAYGGTKRSKAVPEVPTFEEVGMSGFSSSSWYSLAAPVGTPADILDKLADALQRVLTGSRFRAALDAQSAEPVLLFKDDAAEFVAADQAQIATLISETGMALQE